METSSFSCGPEGQAAFALRAGAGEDPLRTAGCGWKPIPIEGRRQADKADGLFPIEPLPKLNKLTCGAFRNEKITDSAAKTFEWKIL